MAHVLKIEKMATNFQPSSEQIAQVLRTKISKLVDELQPEDICDEFLANGFISEEEYELSIDDKKNSKNRSRKLIFSAIKIVKSKYEHFETLCDILNKSGASQLVQDLKRK